MRVKGRGALCAALCAVAVRCACGAETGRESADRSLEALIARTPLAQLRDMPEARRELAPHEVDAARAALWEAYRREQRGNTARGEEHARRQIRLGAAVMRYAYDVIGEKPREGYPLFIALHGGGGAPPSVNDAQWRQMTRYYRASVQEGIYTATRGIADTWNLHFMPESYVMYDRLIENMRIFEDADPDRVVLVGFSAGGDGVYQIVPRMADRWAAAAMSAGHHNNVDPTNLRHVPFLLQVGARDTAYNRHRETVVFAQKLAALGSAHPGAYAHELFVHADKPHNFLDNHPSRAPQPVLADPFAWLEGKDDRAVPRDTNAIAWLARRRRTPLPLHVVWDLKTRADLRGKTADGVELWPGVVRGAGRYWLDLAGHDAAAAGTAVIEVRADPENGRIVAARAGTFLRLLLTGRMFDLSRELSIEVEGVQLAVRPRATLASMIRTLEERGDPRHVFEAACVIEKKDGVWRASTETP